MGFNYGYEKKKFDSRWKRLEVVPCEKAGCNFRG